MSVIRWIEILCDGCGAHANDLRFQDDIGARGLRKEVKAHGWVTKFIEGHPADYCEKCRHREPGA